MTEDQRDGRACVVCGGTEGSTVPVAGTWPQRFRHVDCERLR